MDKQYKLDTTFINIASEISKLSYCTRAKVGALIVKSGNIISFGYNGTPSGMDNCCEEKKYANGPGGWLDEETIRTIWPYEDEEGNLYKLVTKKETIHAESNAIIKAARSGLSTDGSTLYLTMSPCVDCSKLILQSGIKRVVYLTPYVDLSGVDFLCNFIEIQQYEI